MSSVPPINNPFEILTIQLERIEKLLLALVTQVTTLREADSNAPIDRGIGLAIRITGLKKKTIYNLVNKRAIPHSKKGKRLYFDEQELLGWIKSGKRRTKEEWSQTHN